MKLPLLSAFLFITSSIFAQEFKVVGYLATWNFDAYKDKIQWDKLTHVNLAFANPDANGNFQTEGNDIDPVVDIAHQHGVKVFISLAGGSLTPAWQSAWNNWMQPGNLPSFVQKIKQYVQLHGLDGVDIDLEWGNVTDLYSPFILALRPSLDSLGLPLTAALPGSYRYPQINPEALSAFDWVNLMVYDLTGPWAPNSPGQHSPFDWAVQCLQYWQSQGLPGDRQTLGVPFYGYDFGGIPVASFSFADMVATDPSYADLDQVSQAFYNGRPTIRDKTTLAMLSTSGLMIWELGQDAYDDLAPFSLLTAIDEVVHASSASMEVLADQVHVFPNPTNSVLNIGGEAMASTRLQIVDAQSRIWWEGNATAQISVAELPAGMYFLKMSNEETSLAARFVKI